MLRIVTLMFFTLVGLVPTLAPANAEPGSLATAPSQLPADQVAAFANRVQLDLAARGANVAIVARMGRDPGTMPEGVKYTHIGFWVYSQLTKADGTMAKGYQVYNLYQDARVSTRSSLVQDSPAEFFAAVYRLDAGIIIPDKRLQKKLLEVIASPTYAALHNPKYRVLANPETTQFQNSNEFALDVLMASIYGTGDKTRIKANIAAYFKATPIRVSGFKRFFAPLASGALATTDQGATIKTTTFGSIAQFMKENKLESQVYRLTPTKAYRY